MNLTIADVNTIENWWIQKSRVNFLAFRCYLGGNEFKKSGFITDLSKNLQNFYTSYINKESPILIIEAPPQHGKSRAVVEFIAWVIGLQPDLKTIYSSFSERLGVRANTTLQRIMSSSKYNKVFPHISIGESKADIKTTKNSNIFEIINKEKEEVVGSFRNTTVNGAVTGETLDIGVIDDPVKGRKEANSKLVQEGIWDWFTDDFYTRFNESAGLILILTRWSKIDLAERLKSAVVDAEEDEEKVTDNLSTITYKAIAEVDEKFRKEGEPLFPEHKSLSFLMKRKTKMPLESWLSLYQQSPIVRSGNIFVFDHWKWWTALPEIKFLFMFADTASKKNNWNDFTVIQVWGYGFDNNIYLIDMVRKRMESHELRTTAKMLYNKHNTGRLVLPAEYRSPQEKVKLRKLYVEDKSSGIGLIQDFKKDNMKVEAIPRSVDKIERAYDDQPEIESGRVYLCEGVPHVSFITEEGIEFPNGAYDDAIDCTMGAIEVVYFHGLNKQLIGVI